MNNPLFIHTYWSKPALNNRWDVENVSQIINNIWYYTTSVTYLKNLGQRIELHTDDFGFKCMDHIPYDKIHLTLNTIPSNIQSYIWAFGKFWALKDCPLNTIHIDGDVFIKSFKCLNALQDVDCDLIVQCHEFVINPNEWKFSIYKPATDAISSLKYPKWSKVNGQNAYNTGVIKFNNNDLKQAYIKNYLKYAELCSTDKTVCNKCKDKDIAPDLVIEQQFIYDISEYMNCNVKKLIDWTESNKSAKMLGYQHVLGKEKYNYDIILKCKRTLYNLDKNLYIKTCEKIEYVMCLLDYYK